MGQAFTRQGLRTLMPAMGGSQSPCAPNQGHEVPLRDSQNYSLNKGSLATHTAFLSCNREQICYHSPLSRNTVIA